MARQGKHTKQQRQEVVKSVLDLLVSTNSTLQECCKMCGITDRTLHNWRKTFPEIEELYWEYYEKSKEIVKKQHELQLTRLALLGLEKRIEGETIETVTTEYRKIVTQDEKTGDLVEKLEPKRVVKTTRKIPPSEEMIKFCLQSLDPFTYRNEKTIHIKKDEFEAMSVEELLSAIKDMEEKVKVPKEEHLE